MEGDPAHGQHRTVCIIADVVISDLICIRKECIRKERYIGRFAIGVFGIRKKETTNRWLKIGIQK